MGLKLRDPLLWFVAGCLCLFLTGILGDSIFYPHPEGASFRLISDYIISGLLILVALIKAS